MMQAERAVGTEHTVAADDELAEALAPDEVEPESTPKNIVIAVVGILVVIAALIPITYAALTIGSVVFASLSSFLSGGAAGV
ncbi:hypothetical protein [Agromyces ramosus]|uniref:Uncharacterized protein n=1 Tax=Agromyces ramosus TaxID=33879 RepID=A0ABU0R920_9MICO|nr:hypothetical protein [Agromyces ramosus]MDQ0894576.1 hypothetical protein [Agromyces ramosus]